MTVYLYPLYEIQKKEHSIKKAKEILLNNNNIKIEESDEINDSILYNYLTELRVPHKKIVLAQAKLESGNYSSKLFLSNNNLFGIKNSNKRPTVSIKGENGYSKYKNWKMSVIDYILWQQFNIKENVSREEYLNFLKNNYAEDSTYINKLNKIIKNINYENI